MFATLLAFALVSPGAELPVAPPPREPLPPGIDPLLADWTPRPLDNKKAEPWQKMTDKDWIDTRLRDMNTGFTFNCTMRFPLGKGNETVYKATAIKFGETGDAGAVFDRNTLKWNAAWAGGFLHHSDRRFGLLNTPTPKGTIVAASSAGPGWANLQGKWDTTAKRFTAPLPKEWAKYRGLYMSGKSVVIHYTVGDRDVYEMMTLSEDDNGKPGFVRITEVGPGKNAITQAALHPDAKPIVHAANTKTTTTATANYIQNVKEVPVNVLADFRKGGAKRWGEPIVTKLERGAEAGAFAVDTFTIPYKNRFNALFFCTGLDFLKDGRIAMSTCHGDVWLVTVNEKAGTCAWQRYATGLYHPLGVKVVENKVIVLERGQLTRLHDLNNDGEADYYECINNDWDTGGGEHSYDTCLETDPQGNFYFFKTGDTDTPTGGSLITVSKDGAKAEIFSTGFRHPIGMGMSPKGILTGADQEGNWMPVTRIDEYKRGGFYGDMRAHHRTTPPTTYDPPLCWVPHHVDNSAGGQVWVPEKTFGPLAGLPLHFSYGRCRPFVLLRQDCGDGITQGGLAGLGVKFLSGVCRGRFHSDGNLYVCGLNGWQTAAQADGCLQRVRDTGKPLDVPTAMQVKGNTIKLTFSRPLDAKTVSVTDNYRCAWWNYRWSADYGSKRWKVSDPKAEGQDDVPVRSAKLSADGKTLELTFETLKPVMQMQVGYNLKATDGTAVVGSVYLTIHTTK